MLFMQIFFEVALCHVRPSKSFGIFTGGREGAIEFIGRREGNDEGRSVKDLVAWIGRMRLRMKLEFAVLSWQSARLKFEQARRSACSAPKPTFTGNGIIVRRRRSVFLIKTWPQNSRNVR